MKKLLKGTGEVPLLADSCTSLDELEPWQVDALLAPPGDSSSAAGHCLDCIDAIVSEWLESLTQEHWSCINRRKSLYGIPIPLDWIKVWRLILKEPKLRDAEAASDCGFGVGSTLHLWNIWSEDCLEKYLDEIEKELLEMCDSGLTYLEIGNHLLAKYGDAFWKPRKEFSKTTTAQVVNNYLYWKIPNKLARQELTEICLRRLPRMVKGKRIKSKLKSKI